MQLTQQIFQYTKNDEQPKNELKYMAMKLNITFIMNSLKLLHTMRRYGTSYAIATAFFPKEIRNKIVQLYSFVRKPDNIVDKPLSSSDSTTIRKEYLERSVQLRTMLAQRKEEYTKWVSDYALLFHQNNIPFEYSEHFFDAMLSDCDYGKRYSNYYWLEQYMYWSAAVVGFMMNCIMWVTDTRAYEYAKALGEAMQLTNFLRDIREDYVKLWRLYIPIEIQNTFNIETSHIISLCETNRIEYSSQIRINYTNMMKYLIQTARVLYRKAEQWYQYLPDYAIKPISLAASLYEWILDKIEKNNYDVFTKSARTTLFDKYRILIKQQTHNKW